MLLLTLFPVAIPLSYGRMTQVCSVDAEAGRSLVGPTCRLSTNLASKTAAWGLA